jgi:peptidoglycan/LPS O-acetylase OafA/YrhL
MTENNKNIEEKIETKPTRRYDIDAFRVFATILTIYFHTMFLFSWGTGYFIQNKELSVELLFIILFIDIWHMPLFFFLAGISTSYSLNSRTGREYLKERVKRIVIPLILGILIVIPLIVYFERLAWWSDTRYNTENFSGTFFEFYPLYFAIGTIDWYHLWFIAYLSIFSLVALPLFLRLIKDKEKISSIANKYAKGKKIFLFAIPLIVVNVGLRWIFPGYSKYFFDDLAHVFFYLFIFIFGFLIIKDIRFEDSIDRNKKLALILGIISSCFFLILFFLIIIIPMQGLILLLWYVTYYTLFSFSSWCWLIAFYGYGKKLLTKQNSVISYLSNIALPIYIIHLTVIIMIGFYVLQWEAHWVIKFIVISISSMFIIILLCELIKTNNVTRFIFGMRPKVKKTEVN